MASVPDLQCAATFEDHSSVEDTCERLAPYRDNRFLPPPIHHNNRCTMGTASCKHLTPNVCAYIGGESLHYIRHNAVAPRNYRNHQFHIRRYV